MCRVVHSPVRMVHNYMQFMKHRVHDVLRSHAARNLAAPLPFPFIGQHMA